MENKGRNPDGTFTKGSSEAGRKEGSRNKFTNLKDVFLKVFEDIGGAEGLEQWVSESKYNKRLFYQWITKMLPAAVEGDVKGDITLIVKKVVTNERPDE